MYFSLGNYKVCNEIQGRWSKYREDSIDYTLRSTCYDTLCKIWKNYDQYSNVP